MEAACSNQTRDMMPGRKPVAFWKPILSREWMEWGIRGHYGHETGAMISGMLVGLTLRVARS